MRHQLPLALVLVSSTFGIGCTTDSDDGTDSAAEVSSAIERENGGLDTSDEAPMFGQDSAYDAIAMEGEASVTDPMASDPAVSSLESAPDVARHRVLIAWGHMPVDLTATAARDWSGSLKISRGAMVVGRTIGFEEATDHVLPRTSPDQIDFQSVTKPFADGLVLRVLVPASTDGAPHLTYTSTDGTHTLDLDLAALIQGPISLDAGDGNRVVAVALRDNDACDHGFMRGRWVALKPGMGVYRGTIANAEGEPTGHIRGIWGQRQNGDKVMFGKFIATDGSFRGLLVGTYEAGHYHARWITRAGDHGLAAGVYFDAPNVRGGVFAGRWGETSCEAQ